MRNWEKERIFLEKIFDQQLDRVVLPRRFSWNHSTCDDAFIHKEDGSAR